MSKFVGTRSSSYKRRIYWAVVSQRLRNTVPEQDYVSLRRLELCHSEGFKTHCITLILKFTFFSHLSRPNIRRCVFNLKYYFSLLESLKNIMFITDQLDLRKE
jgi:hypothetical protein